MISFLRLLLARGLTSLGSHLRPAGPCAHTLGGAGFPCSDVAHRDAVPDAIHSPRRAQSTSA